MQMAIGQFEARGPAGSRTLPLALLATQQDPRVLEALPQRPSSDLTGVLGSSHAAVQAALTPVLSDCEP